MTPLFAYLIKSSLSAALLYLLFRLTMRRHNQHAVNRILLMTIMLFSAIVPFIDIQLLNETEPVRQIQLFRELVAIPEVTDAIAVEPGSKVVTDMATSNPINYWKWAYYSIISLFVLQLSVGIIRVVQLLKKASKYPFQDVLISVVKEVIQPFSFFNWIVLSEKDFNENKNIVVTHERAHIKLGHTFDLMVSELFCVMHFFNPMVWMMRRDLKLIHEYQADQAVLNQGIDAQKYQLLVLEKAVGKRRFAMASQFTQKPILKRLNMMKNSNVEKWAVVKLFLFVPLLALLLQAFARPELIRNVNELIPTIQKDSTELWLEQWTPENLQNLNGGLMTEMEVVKPLRPGSKSTVSNRKNKYPVISKKDILEVLINYKSLILLEGKIGQPKEVYAAVRKFIAGESPVGRANDVATKVEKQLPLAGKVSVSKGVITLRHDVGTDKAFIRKMVKEIGKIYLEARNNAATKTFGKKYFQLSVAQKSDIDQMIPIRVSIIEPKKTRNAPPPPPPYSKFKVTSQGTVMHGGKKLSLSELIERIELLKKLQAKHNKKYKKNIKLQPVFDIDHQVSKSKLEELKRMIKNSSVSDVEIVWIIEDK
ncbi:M56 family metallopeptidase [Prolixibacteraceae bacterium JC049]|nr:M56 family metallopeptidase [Prolixibacteraceae bacterium JC049]